VLTDEKLLAMFKQFDTDGSGFITKDNLRAAFVKLGKNLSEAELTEII
jgi:Ca2+-binding EF-hand superfamily protein